jgi:hypothetical protein
MKRKYYILGVLALLCLLGTGYYAWTLYVAYRKQVAEWNEGAKAAFEEALWMEVNKRAEVPILYSSSEDGNMKTLGAKIPDTIFITSPLGRKGYHIEHDRFERSLVKDSDKRAILGALLYEYPLSIDTLAILWNNKLFDKEIPAQSQIRYVYTDWDLQNDTVYSGASKPLGMDSLSVNYLGFRCEHELVGYVSYPFWLSFLSFSEWGFLLLPWCVWGLLFAFYVPMERFIKKKLVREKEVHVADVPIEKAKVYRLPDETVFDTFAGTLVRGKEKTSLSPQSVNLLKLFVRTTDFQATVEDIDSRLWYGKGSKEQLRSAIFRLRKDLKAVHSPLVIQNEGGIYELKIPHSIEES